MEKNGIYSVFSQTRNVFACHNVLLRKSTSISHSNTLVYSVEWITDSSPYSHVKAHGRNYF